MQRKPGPISGCGGFQGSGRVDGLDIAMDGTYTGDQVVVTISTPSATSPTETATYEGSITGSVDLSTSDSVSTLPLTIQEPHGTTHGLFGRLWLSGGDYTLVFDTYPSPSLDEDPVSGYLTACGVKIPFSGTEHAGNVELTMDLDGVDLSPCPALDAAWSGRTEADLSGRLTQGVGQLSLNAPVNTVLDRPNR
jgi:hypothetical protein